MFRFTLILGILIAQEIGWTAPFALQCQVVPGVRVKPPVQMSDLAICSDVVAAGSGIVLPLGSRNT